MRLLTSLFALVLTALTIAVTSYFSGITPLYLWNHPIEMFFAVCGTIGLSVTVALIVDANYDGIMKYLRLKKYNYKLYTVYSCCIGAFLCALFASASKSPLAGIMAVFLLVLGIVITVTNNNLVDENPK
jgi:hypothetical protein